jgi:hypothetical protein
MTSSSLAASQHLKSKNILRLEEQNGNVELLGKCGKD